MRVFSRWNQFSGADNDTVLLTGGRSGWVAKTLLWLTTADVMGRGVSTLVLFGLQSQVVGMQNGSVGVHRAELGRSVFGRCATCAADRTLEMHNNGHNQIGMILWHDR